MGDLFEAADDKAAAARAGLRHVTGEARELWQGGRLVGRFSKLGDFSAGSGD